MRQCFKLLLFRDFFSETSFQRLHFTDFKIQYIYRLLAVISLWQSWVGLTTHRQQPRKSKTNQRYMNTRAYTYVHIPSKQMDACMYTNIHTCPRQLNPSTSLVGSWCLAHDDPPRQAGFPLRFSLHPWAYDGPRSAWALWWTPSLRKLGSTWALWWTPSLHKLGYRRKRNSWQWGSQV